MSVAIVFDFAWANEGPGEAFQSVIDSMAGLLVEVTPADGSSPFEALLVGGLNPEDDLEDEEDRLDEVQIRRVSDADLEPVAGPEYIRVKALKLSS